MTSLNLTTIFLVLAGLWVIFCLIKFIFGFILTSTEANREAKIYRFKQQSKYRHMLTHDLWQSLFNHAYFSGGLKDTKALERFFSLIREKNEKQLVKELNESKLYNLLVKAEFEIGLKGRPEAIDYFQDIWDILLELSRRTNEIN